MPYLDYNGSQIEVDEDGFITDTELWDEDLARYLAKQAEGIDELTEDHWKLIFYLNKYYEEFQRFSHQGSSLVHNSPKGF